VAVGRHFGVSAPGKPKGKNPCLRKSRNPGTRNPDALCGRKEESRKDLDRPSEETRGERSEFGESSEIPWTVGSKSSRIVDLLHESPYRDSGIGVTRVLESLHRELPVHETPKRSEPLDPRHREPLDLIQELEYRVSGFEESKDLTLLHFELPISEIPIRPGPSDQGRLIAIDLPLEGNFGDYRVSGIRKGEEETSHRDSPNREKPVSALSI
jgi:hypothetical protein